MKKNLLKIGKTLTKNQQKLINGGGYMSNSCETAEDCYDWTVEHEASCYQEWSCQQTVCVPEELICE